MIDPTGHDAVSTAIGVIALIATVTAAVAAAPVVVVLATSVAIAAAGAGLVYGIALTIKDVQEENYGAAVLDGAGAILSAFGYGPLEGVYGILSLAGGAGVTLVDGITTAYPPDEATPDEPVNTSPPTSSGGAEMTEW